MSELPLLCNCENLAKRVQCVPDVVTLRRFVKLPNHTTARSPASTLIRTDKVIITPKIVISTVSRSEFSSSAPCGNTLMVTVGLKGVLYLPLLS